MTLDSGKKQERGEAFSSTPCKCTVANMRGVVVLVVSIGCTIAEAGAPRQWCLLTLPISTAPALLISSLKAISPVSPEKQSKLPPVGHHSVGARGKRERCVCTVSHNPQGICYEVPAAVLCINSREHVQLDTSTTSQK